MMPIDNPNEVLAKLGITSGPKPPVEKDKPASLASQWGRRADDREETWEESPTKSKLRYYVGGLVIAAAIGGVHLFSVATAPPLYTAEEAVQSAQVAIFLTHQEIETFREESGRLPTNEELGLDDDEVYYDLRGDVYFLTVSPDGLDDPVVFQSGEEIAPFEAAFVRELNS